MDNLWSVQIKKAAHLGWETVVEGVSEDAARRVFTDYEVRGLTNDHTLPKPFWLQLLHGLTVQLGVWHR